MTARDWPRRVQSTVISYRQRTDDEGRVYDSWNGRVLGGQALAAYQLAQLKVSRS